MASSIRGRLQACLWILLIVLFPSAHAAEDAHVLVLGRISDDPREHYEQLKAMLDYVVPRMQDVGITEGKVLMAQDPQQMANYLRRGKVDWVTETASTAVQLQQRAQARPLLLTERGGVSWYHTVFFTRKDSGIASLQDLRGHSLALQRILSTSAYMVPMSTLLEAGITPEMLPAPGDVPAPGQVGYLFARSESNVASWVHKRVVDAGALSNLDWQDPRRVPPAFLADLRIIHETAPYPRALELVRVDIDPKVGARLREVLLAAGNDPDAAPALKRFFNSSRFLPVDARVERSLEVLRDGSRRVRAEVE